MHALERCIRAVSRKDPDIQKIKDRLQSVKSDIDNLTHNLQGFVDPNNEKDDFFSKSHVSVEDEHKAEIDAIIQGEFKAMDLEKEKFKAQMKEEQKAIEKAMAEQQAEMMTAAQAQLAAMQALAPSSLTPFPQMQRIQSAPVMNVESMPVANNLTTKKEIDKTRTEVDEVIALNEAEMPETGAEIPESTKEVATNALQNKETSKESLAEDGLAGKTSANEERVEEAPAEEARAEAAPAEAAPVEETPAAEALAKIPIAEASKDRPVEKNEEDVLESGGASPDAEIEESISSEHSNLGIESEIEKPADEATSERISETGSGEATAQVANSEQESDAPEDNGKDISVPIGSENINEPTSIGSPRGSSQGSEEGTDVEAPLAPLPTTKKKVGWKKIKARKQSVLITKNFTSPARMRWRKAIKNVIMNNRRNTGMLGMLGSRVPKGQSLADRMNRLENHIFDLRKELLSNGMMELTSSFKDDMNEIKDSHASLMDMLRKAGLGDADGILSQLVAMDAANKLKELESLLVCIPCHLSGIFCRLSLHSAASKLAYVLFFLFCRRNLETGE